MKVQAAFALLLPFVSLCHAQELPCRFVLGYAEPKPAWFVVSGDATLQIQKNNISVVLYDDRLKPEMSHTISVVLNGKRVSGKLVNLFSDEGQNGVTGNYESRIYTDAEGKKLNQSLIVQNAHLFAAVTCNARIDTRP